MLLFYYAIYRDHRRLLLDSIGTVCVRLTDYCEGDLTLLLLLAEYG